ncbi:deoxycytidylate deaminase [Plasmopara halstedii]|uniref:dCMP deaminase n=1 Tax=Plasmopara halstedii TaxID=4781 RepID=A0A0P1AHV1_PLAHL|nr:deoxycytidylate deaminase [Plasmopara halstedii]CEG40293.1 deoxycytidylate deaminase [Plasmopara halstedii]|eukprot:XP_024576662.1 deoxycytidylate deaminase [Plasmopara halstedii]
MVDQKLSGRQMMELFYTEVDQALSIEEKANAPSLFRCKCGTTRSQRLKSGYTNLVQHVMFKHKDWVVAASRGIYPTSILTSSHSEKLKRKRNATLKVAQSSEKKPKTLNKVKTLQSTTSTVIQKRSNYLSWEDYFMSVAFLSAMRSKDPSTQVGACIVSSERKIVGIGYNGFPNGCGDDDLPWARESQTNSHLDTKYPYVCHAEMNAILNKNSTDVKGCTIYVALFPCNECAKLIIQSGISRVIYCSDKYNSDWKFVASRRLFDMAGVQYMQHKLELSKVVIDFTSVI